LIGSWTPPPGSDLLLNVEVPGDYVPAGSKRGTCVRFKNSGGKWRVKTWMDKEGHQHAQVNVSDVNATKLEKRAKKIQAAVKMVAEGSGFEIPDKDVPVAVVVTFFRRRGKGHYGAGRNADVLKDSAPAFPITAPDATKLWRGFEDALTGVAWHDDSRVAAQCISEEFLHRWEEPTTHFSLYRLPATVAELRAVSPEELTLPT
jgi:hypothetical protein